MADKLRRVASLEGSQYYGLPIGAPITADAKAKAKLKNGGAEPTGASKGTSNSGGNASAASNAKAAMEKAASTTPKAPKEPKAKLKKPTIKGNMHFKAGKTSYTAPNGSKLFKQKGVDGLAYVYTPDGKVHIFNENGEVETDSKVLLAALSSKFQDGLDPEDADFEEAEFDKVGAHFGLDQMPVGSVLTDQRGNPIFTKNEDGTWHNDDLDIDLDEKAIKPIFDSGDLLPEETPETEAVSEVFASKEAVNFKEMDYSEATAALDEMRPGAALSLTGEIPSTLIKQEDGTWKSPTDLAAPGLPSALVAYAKDQLQIADTTEVTPDMGEDGPAPLPKAGPAYGPPDAAPVGTANADSSTPPPPAQATPTDRAAASKAAAAQAKIDNNPFKPEEVNWETTYPSDGEWSDEVENATYLQNTSPGDKIMVTFYDPDAGLDSDDMDYVDIAVFTRQEDGSWLDQDSIQSLTQDQMENHLWDADTKVWKSDKNSNRAAEYAKMGKEELKKALQDDGILASDEDSKDNKIASPGEEPPAPEPQPSFNDGDDVSGKFTQLVEGDTITKMYTPASGSGTQVPPAVFTKQADDKWLKKGADTSVKEWVITDTAGSKGKTTFQYGDTTPKAPEPADAPETPWDQLQEDDSPTEEWLKQTPVGSKFSIDVDGDDSVDFIKADEGTWKSGFATFKTKDVATLLDGGYPSTITSTGETFQEIQASVAPTVDHKTVGGVPSTIEEMKSYDTGTVLLYTKKDGGKSKYVKLATGDFLTPGGQVMPPEKLKNGITQGKFEVSELPAAPVAVEPSVDAPGINDKYLVPNAVIDKFSVLNNYPLGTQIKNAGSSQIKGIQLVKQEDGWWGTNIDEYMPTEELEEELKKDQVFFVALPQSDSDQANSPALNPDAAPVHSTSKNITFDGAGQAFSAAELMEAHDAMEAHSGPQIAYGLKAVPENVFADKDMQTKLKAWGKTAYPDLPPKQAALNVLKDKLGLAKTPAAKAAPKSSGADISFGASGDDIKTTATGLTGGAFSKADVQDAIEILSAFQGKNFKSELNKKGNPLGQLSPNDLVGFDKDKTVVKQKFIDLLQTKLDQAPEEETPEPEVEETGLAAWEEELLNSAGSPSISNAVNNADIYSFPVGTVLTDDLGFTYTHVADGWDSGFTVFTPDNLALSSDTYFLTSMPSTEESVAPEELPAEVSAPSQDMADAPTQNELDAANKGGFQIGTPVTEAALLDALPAGSEIINGKGVIGVKQAEGTWITTIPKGGSHEHPSSVLADAFKGDGGSEYGYTIKSISTQKNSLDTTTPLTGEQMSTVPVGAVVNFNSKYDMPPAVYTKLSDDQWTTEWYGETTLLDNDTMVQHHSETEGTYTYVSVPDGTPSYASTPEAVQDKNSDQDIDPYEIKFTPAGKVYQHSNGETFYVKTGVNEWLMYKKDGTVQGTVGSNLILSVLEDGDLQQVSYDGPEYNKAGLMPGKYSSGAAAVMYVHANGSGTYVNSKGVASKLTPLAVTKNHDSGMNMYFGASEDAPAVESKPKTTAAKKPTKLGDAVIPDGTYFVGNPSDPKAVLWHVEGDTVTIQKPIGSTTNSSKKIGQDADQNWFANATLGAQVTGQGGEYFSYDETYTKTEAGWTNSTGGVVDLSTIPYYGYGYATIKNHGFGTAETVTKAKAQAQAKKGTLVDQYGNSIVPAGYTGPVMFFGAKTSIPALVKLDQMIEDEGDSAFKNMKNVGVFVGGESAKKYVKDEFGALTVENNKAAVTKAVKAQIAGLDTSVPEGDASELFVYNAMGQPMAPESMHDSYLAYDKTSQGKYIKKIADEFGGGGIIGQHVSNMDEYERQHWIDWFKQGNFAEMYKIEVSAAASKNDSHISGFRHPGYEGNTETNKIGWAPAVEGELSAAESVPGNWTQKGAGVVPSMAEVNNYLISAQMQNPTYLSDHEKRQWMSYHQLSNQPYVDSLSVAAKQRKEQGQAQLTDEPMWTENLVPTKAHDILFENGVEFPTSWSGSQADSYMDFHSEDLELSNAYDEFQKKNPYSYSPAPFLADYFQKKADAKAAADLIPVYTKTPNQTVKKSTHPITQYHDQFGNKFYFKHRPNTKEDKYRVEAEHLGNSLSRALGFKTAKSELMTVDGKYGVMQSDVSGVSDFSGFDFKSLTVKQIADIEGEHLLDYFMNNDDAKYDNAKIQADGSVIGIDKARSFGFYGQWDWEGSAADGNTTIYQNMYSAIRNGSFSKEDLDKAYLKARRTAVKMSKFSDDRLTGMLDEGMKNRETFNVPYKIDGKLVSQDLDGLKAATLDRKSKLPEIFDEKWTKLYADAKLGDLPEDNDALGDVISGFQHSKLHEETFEAKAAGKVTMVGGASVIGGTAHLWTDQYKDGSTNLNGEMYLAPKAQEELLAHLSANATDVSADKAETTNFDSYDTFNAPLLSAVKTVNQHVEDGAYNPTTISKFEEKEKHVQGDLAEWTPDLTSNAKTLQGEPAYKFAASGTTVPMTHVDQYKMMLDYYAPQVQNIRAALDAKENTGQYEGYKPVKVASNDTYYSKDDGSTLTPLTDKKWLLKDATSGEVSVTDKEPEASEGWSKVENIAPPASMSSVKITKRSYTNENKATLVNGVKVVDKDHVGNVMGSWGQEYEIELETGEKIFFRNAGNTNTGLGQQGKLMFRADGVDDPQKMSSALANIEDQLSALGIDTTPQDETAAELTYWREMYGVLQDRKHESGSPYAAAQADMEKKVQEVSQQNASHFLENLDASMTPQEQAQYWRALWAKHFGQDKVDKLIADEAYLPKFDHSNYDNPELETGKPYWERFDVDLDELLGEDFLLASALGAGADPGDLVRSGGSLGAEERLRQLEDFTAGGKAWSAEKDQKQHGSSHNIYTRIISDSAISSYNAFFNPRMMLRTRTYSSDSDRYGDKKSRKNYALSNVKAAVKEYKTSYNSGNETNLPHAATMLDGIEVYAFDDAAQRNAAIQHLKEKGIEVIRGLPVEDRLVMKTNLKAAIEKIKKTYQKGQLA